MIARTAGNFFTSLTSVKSKFIGHRTPGRCWAYKGRYWGPSGLRPLDRKVDSRLRLTLPAGYADKHPIPVKVDGAAR